MGAGHRTAGGDSAARQGISRSRTVWFYVKITLLVFGISGLWQSMHSLILPIRILDFVPEAQKNTYLGLLTFSGLVIAMLAQPVAGAISDRSRMKWGRRRPFILGGIAAAALILPVIGAATTIVALFIGYCLLQVATNTAQGPLQAFIPEMVPGQKRGYASGIKSLLEILGGAVLLFPVSVWIDLYSSSGKSSWLWITFASLGLILVALMLYTVFSVREKRPSAGLKNPAGSAAWISSFRFDIRKNRPFMWFLLSRLAVFMALATIQQFALYFFRDVIGVSDPAAATTRFIAISVASMLVAVLPAGYISDRIGRKPIAIASACTGAFGVLIILINQASSSMMIAAVVLGLALGAFTSTNWALATDLVAAGQEARYLGIANMATAGGAALARLIGPVIDFFNRGGQNTGYTVMLMATLAYFLAGALLLTRVNTGKPYARSAETTLASPTD